MNVESIDALGPQPAHRAFAALENRDFRKYFLMSAGAMMADNIDHVISYWINAPSDIRGRVIGVFSMPSPGMRTFSGVSVGLLGAKVGIHRSLALSAAALLVVCLAALTVGRGGRR